MKGRPLASGRSARWALMERFEVPDYDDPSRNYLTRWRLVQTPLFALYLHRMDGPDPRPTLHDHPWPFVSFILRGGYWEDRLNAHTLVTKKRRVRWINRMPVYGAHSIRTLLRTPTWTFLVVGRRVRTWGYWEQIWSHQDADGPKAGHWRWTEFNRHLHASEFDAALARRKGVAR